MKKAQIGTTVLFVAVAGLSGYKLAHQYRIQHKAIAPAVVAPKLIPVVKLTPAPKTVPASSTQPTATPKAIK